MSNRIGPTDPRNPYKHGNIPGAMTIVNPSPEIIVAMAPKTGRLKLLHALYDSTTDSNIREKFFEVWHYANHDDMTELNFVVALGRRYSALFPGQPLPMAADEAPLMPQGPIVATPAAWEGLRRAVQLARPAAKVPERNCWSKKDDSDLWRGLVGQVAVIGKSAPWEKAQTDWEQSDLTWTRLVALDAKTPAGDIAGRVQKFFSAAGIRYAGKGDELSKKARGVAQNFIRVRAFGGPRAVFAAFAAVEADTERIALVQALLSQVGPKGSRDLLMNVGLLREAIAIDDRVESILFAARVIPAKSVEGRDYATVEASVLENVARPLGWEGVELDRTMYQQWKSIRKALGDDSVGDED